MKIAYYYPPSCPFDVIALCDPAPGYNNGRAIAGAVICDKIQLTGEIEGIAKKFNGELIEFYAKDVDDEPDGFIECPRDEIPKNLVAALDHAIITFIDKDYVPAPHGWTDAGGPTPQ